MRKTLTHFGLGLGLLLAPSLARAQKALVYCPVTVDRIGCDAIASALTGPAYPGGIDLGYDGTGGTVDLRTADLFGYQVFLVPSLADDPQVRPYALLRDPDVAGHLRAALLGELVTWSGMPDQGSANRAQKDDLIRNLAAWAGSNFAAAHGPGLVALLDLSDEEGARYDWLRAITPFNVNADAAPLIYASVRALTPAATAALTGSAGGPIAYPGMAVFGFLTVTPTPGISLDAVGSTGTSQGGQVVLVTLAAANTSGPVLTTDKHDFQPGDTVTFSGSGWDANEVVTITIHEDPLQHGDRSITVTADASGRFTNRTFAIEVQHLLVRFVATAGGGTSGARAQTTFTDAWLVGLFLAFGSPTSTGAGGTATFNVDVILAGFGSPCSGRLHVESGLPAGATSTEFFFQNATPSPSFSSPSFTAPIQVTTAPNTTPGFYSIIIRADPLSCDPPPAGQFSSNPLRTTLGVYAARTWSGGSFPWDIPHLWTPEGVPTPGEIVVINNHGNPTLPAGSVSVRHLVINTGGSVSMPNATNLEITGEFRNSGTFNATAGRVIFNGIGSDTASFAGTNQFHDVEIKFSKDPNFDVAAGALIKVGGSWINGANGPSLDDNATTVEFNGSSERQDIVGTASFHHFVVSGTEPVLVVQPQSVAGDLTVSGVSLELIGTMNRATVGGTLTIGNGSTLKIGRALSLPANYATHVLGPTSTVEYNGFGFDQLVAPTTYGHLVIGATGTKTIPAGTTVAGNATMKFGAVVVATGGITVNGNWNLETEASFNPGIFTHFLGGSLTRNSGARWTSTGTLVLDGTAGQTLTSASGPFTATFGNLTVNNGAGVTLVGDQAVSGDLRLENGRVTTGASTLSALGTVTRGAGTDCIAGTSCFVAGNLRKPVPAGSSARTWEIGTASTYAPASVAITSATAAGFLTATTIAGPHPSLASSGISSSRYVNRYWRLTATGFGVAAYDATFAFAPTDLVGAPNTAALAIRKFNSPATWSSPAAGSSTATSATGTGFTSFSDYAIGELLVPQIISFDPLANRTWGDGPFALSATGGGSGNPVTFSVTAGNGTVCSSGGANGATITILAAGSCTIRADQAGTDTYGAASPVSQVLTVDPAPTVTVVTFEADPYTYRGTEFTASAQVTGVLGFSQAVPVILTGDCTHVTTADGCTATATFAASGNHAGSADSKSITILRQAVTPTIAANDKPYDGTPTATLKAVDGCTVAPKVGDDDVACAGSASFGSRNAGPGTVTSNELALTGSTAGNYELTTTTATTTAEIFRLAVTVTAVANTKVFDNTVSAAAVPTVSPALGAGDTEHFSETYDNPNVGTGKTLTPAGTVEDGNGGNNYILSFSPQNLGTITEAPTTTTVSVAPTTQQYSDKVVLTATVTPAAAIPASSLSGSVQFKVGGSDQGAPVTIACGATRCTADYTYTVTSPQSGSTLSVRATFTSPDGNIGASASLVDATVTVTKEDAAVFDEAVSPGQIPVGGSGSLTFKIRERNPETNAGTLAAAGDIANLTVAVTAQGVLDPGKTITFSCGAPVPNGLSGYAKVLTVTCPFGPVNAADAYDVSILIGGNLYQGSGGTVIQVTDPALGFATGGGWYWAGGVAGGDKVTFAFLANAELKNKKTTYRGALVVIRHKANGDVVRVKSNVFDGYAIQTGSPCSAVTFSGKATYQVNGNTLGNFGFSGYGKDCGEPGTVDQFGLYLAMSPNEVATSPTLAGLVASARTLSGGNVQVP